MSFMKMEGTIKTRQVKAARKILIRNFPNGLLKRHEDNPRLITLLIHGSLDARWKSGSIPKGGPKS